MPDRETVIANIREDIDLLTHDRQPTTEELRIINDLSAAIALMEEQGKRIRELESMNIIASGNGTAIGVVHGGLVIKKGGMNDA